MKSQLMPIGARKVSTHPPINKLQQKHKSTVKGSKKERKEEELGFMTKITCSKVPSAFLFRLYNTTEEKIVDVDFNQLLPEKFLTKMSKTEFRCYLKALKGRGEPLCKSEIALIKKIDKRVRNKETVRKSKKRLRDEFLLEKKRYEEQYSKYSELLKNTKQLLKTVEECQHSQSKVGELKTQLEKPQLKFVVFDM
ncbi:hypothetical protein EIN_080880 [Entamoeba invadens IP1]|uniref:hypothetical protein n=1 Tax=Entamoeba invadens IP1 TaxID=370355 RepID=UPI0002C3E0AB|nr:hypothetical protein EIN_080880 [Entamoeba invadens IP1]ELP85116.1 hypothetical protein EIN_080880 [Entamoeba invadens IP1]|eukprot:XP_004184462.1 hypothetical protein EIN_080880 [Entamoeba invadens IP1]